MVKGIIFDVDNTLVDFYRMKNLSVSESIDAMIDAGLDMKKEKALKVLHEIFNELGLEAHQIYQKFSKKVLGKVDHKIVAAAIVAHKSVWNGFLHTYPGVISTLIQLKKRGLKLGVVSDAAKLHVFERLYGMRIGEFFDVVVTHDDTHKFKPARRPFVHALKIMKLKPEECIMLGDWLKGDVGGAKKMGMTACLARYGVPTSETKKIMSPSYFKKYSIKPDYTLDKFSDLLKIVNGLK
ncbi:MAG: HAD family hydrolase [Candidatus Nanoarchaeia archaeon]